MKAWWDLTGRLSPHALRQAAAVKAWWDLTGRVALVTGASRGIGRALALALAEAGADLACVARTSSALAESAPAIEALGRRALPLTVDVTDHDSVEQAVARTVEVLGSVDNITPIVSHGPPRPRVFPWGLPRAFLGRTTSGSAWTAWMPKYLKPEIINFIGSRMGQDRAVWGTNGLPWKESLDQVDGLGPEPAIGAATGRAGR